MGEKILSFRDLKVYRKSLELQQEIFEISKGFPVEERYSLTDQIRRSSRSIGANISEAWKKRRYEAHFISKLTDSDAENAETQHWLLTAYMCSYIIKAKHNDLIHKSNEIGGMLGKMMNEPQKWTISR